MFSLLKDMLSFQGSALDIAGALFFIAVVTITTWRAAVEYLKYGLKGFWCMHVFTCYACCVGVLFAVDPYKAPTDAFLGLLPISIATCICRFIKTPRKDGTPYGAVESVVRGVIVGTLIIFAVWVSALPLYSITQGFRR